MPRARRLSGPDQFQAVRRGGCGVRDGYFIVRAVQRTDGLRVGIAVSRRVSPKAVTRNRIKRQIRESFRLHQAMFPDMNIVVVAQAAAATANNSVLARALSRHWEQLLRQCKEL